MATYNSMASKRWQICSDDHVWMFPAEVSLSTVELNGEIYRNEPYESCIFYANGDSDVLTRYKTQEEAEIGHVELEKQFKLKRISKDEFKV